MTEPRYIEPTAASRGKLAGAVVAAFAVGLAFEWWLASRLEWVASLPTCESLPWVRVELLAGLLICWYISYAAFGQGTETWKTGQTPLPNTWVWSRTRVRTGGYAKFTAIATFATSAIFLLGPVVVIAWQELYLIFCFPQSCGCP
jgi:hypothetical protein